MTERNKRLNEEANTAAAELEQEKSKDNRSSLFNDISEYSEVEH
jgi:hypothetical protein